MLNKTICTLLMIIISMNVVAQKKKDLLDEIEKLRGQLKVVKNDLVDEKKSRKIAETKVSSIETQLNDLQQTNDMLLKQMSGFTELSNQKAKNLETSLETIKIKDKQLSIINKALTESDSLKLAVLTVFKQSLGSDAPIAFKNGEIFISIPNNNLFGAKDTNTKVQESAKSLLSKISKTLIENPDIKIIIEGNSNALKFDKKIMNDNWDLSALQASSLVRILQNDYKIDPKRMKVLARSEYGASTIETSTRILIDPKFDDFYVKIKENMKENSKKKP